MIEKIGHIRNPLTVIAIFAAISEVGGTLVLPFLEPESQKLYLWFLMGFPILLVLVFFITLNWNHRVLYAPSDYKDENNFLRMLSYATEEERIQKLEQEASESAKDEEEGVSDSHSVDADQPSRAGSRLPRFEKVDKSHVSRASLDEYRQVEELALNHLSGEIGIDFLHREVALQVNDRRRIIFDALAIEPTGDVHAVEVKYSRLGQFSPAIVERTILQAEYAARSYQSQHSQRFVLHLVFVLKVDDGRGERIRKMMEDKSKAYDVEIEVHIFNLDEMNAKK